MKRQSFFLTSFIITINLSSLIVFLNHTMNYDFPAISLFFSSLILLLLPDLRFLFEKRWTGILALSISFLLFLLPFFLIPFFSAGELFSFYSDLTQAAIRTFEDEMGEFILSYQAIVFMTFLVICLGLKGFLLRLEKIAGIVLSFLQVAALVSILILGRRQEQLPFLLIVLSILMNLMFFFYSKRVQLKNSQEQTIFFLQSVLYGLVFSLIVFGAYQINSDPFDFLRITINNTVGKYTDEDLSEDETGTVLMDEESGVLDLTSPFPDRQGIALIVLSQKPVYLKSHVLNTYNGREWIWTDAQSDLPFNMIGQGPQNRTLEFFTAEAPIDILYRELTTIDRVRPPFTYNLENYSDDTRSPYGYGSRYKAYYYTPSNLFWEKLHNSSANANSIYNISANIPDMISELANEITEDLDSPYAKARYLEDYLRHQYYYSSLPPEPPEEGDLTEFFLFESRKGFCTHFASALALLCRSVGIPTRIAVGYVAQDGREREEDNRLIFTISHREAHAWTEAYFPDYGWIPLDATPRYSSVYDSYLNDEYFHIARETETGETITREKTDFMPAIIAGGIALILLWPFLISLLIKIRYKTPRQRLSLLFHRFIRLLKIYQYPTKPSRTLNEIRQELSRDQNSESIIIFLEKLEKTLYRDYDFTLENLKILKKHYQKSQNFFLKKGKLLRYLFYKYLRLI